MDQPLGNFSIAMVSGLSMGVASASAAGALWLRKRQAKWQQPTQYLLEQYFKPVEKIGEVTYTSQDDEYWRVRCTVEDRSVSLTYRSILDRPSHKAAERKLALQDLQIRLPERSRFVLNRFRDDVRELTNDFGGRVQVADGRLVWRSPFTQPGKSIGPLVLLLTDAALFGNEPPAAEAREKVYLPVERGE